MRQWLVDAFADAPFKGNQACVVEPFDAWPDAAWMQSLAAENNQAETAFLLKTADPARFGLRWFTPAIEVPLCGHATLASGHVALVELGLGDGAVSFDTQSGALGVTRAGQGYEMNFPADPPRRSVGLEGLAEALGARPLEIWAGMFVVAVLEDEAQVHAASPDFRALKQIGTPGQSSFGNVAVTARADAGSDYDVVSRFFAPGSGIDEDPATGSLHCILGPLWSQRLGKPVVNCFQAYPGRGAMIEVEPKGERAFLRGGALTVLEGRLRV